MDDLWTYPQELGNLDIKGFDVEAPDGKVGTVEAANYDPGTSFLVVETGPLVFGKARILPASLIESVDRGSETVYVGWAKEQIKHAPEYDSDRVADPDHWARLNEYYRDAGTRDRGEAEASEATARRS
jgi:hypothetical protein